MESEKERGGGNSHCYSPPFFWAVSHVLHPLPYCWVVDAPVEALGQKSLADLSVGQQADYLVVAGILDGNAVQVESALDDVELIEHAGAGWVRTGGAKKHYVDEWGVGFEAS